jgi:hypothetical protein
VTLSGDLLEEDGTSFAGKFTANIRFRAQGASS